MPLVTVKAPFRETLDFGVGFDSNSTSPMNTVVEGEISGVVDADGGKAGFHISQIRTTHELETALKIDAKVGYGSVAFGAGVEDRFNFAVGSKIETSSLFLLISADVCLATHSIDRPALTADAAALVGNPTMFSTRYGDMFVRGVGRGGLFAAVLSIETSDEKSTKEIANKLSGAYGAFSGDAETKFSEVRRDYQCRIDTKVYHEGGPVDLFPEKIDDPALLLGLLRAWFKSFVENPGKNAIPYFVILAPTSIASGPLPLNQAQNEHAQDVLVTCARQRSAALDGLNLMDAILRTPTRYVFTPPTSLADISAASAGYQADLETIAQAASLAMNHPDRAKMAAEFAAEKGRKFPQGTMPQPMPAINAGELGNLASRGRFMALSDPLLASLREAEPEGPARFGFEVGLAIAEGHTAPGPGKEKFKLDHMKDFDPNAYQRAVDYSIDRNANFEIASKGAAAVAAKPEATAARARLPLSNQWLGFNIAAGLFASIADGALGHTSQGPGSNRIRTGLSSSRPGYDAALAFYRVP